MSSGRAKTPRAMAEIAGRHLQDMGSVGQRPACPVAEERTPPPKQPKVAKVAPVRAPTVGGRPGTMSISSAKALATYAPRPQYPYEARSRHITGSGVCVVDVDVGSGSVTGASMAQSIGSPILDNAAMSAFRQWRFRPGSVSKVKIPITFTMTGASY